MADEDDDDTDALEEAVDSAEPDTSDDEKEEDQDDTISGGDALEKSEPAPKDEDEEVDKEEAENEEDAQDLADTQVRADELRDMMKQAKGKDEIETEPESQLDRYQNFINEYRRLQGNRQKADLVAGLMAAGGKIGQSIAGRYSGNFTPDLTGVKLMQEAASRPVTDLELQQGVMGKGMQLQSMQQANDPKSPQSKMVRDYLNQRIPGINLGDDVSAADAQMLLKTVGRPVQAKYQKVNGTWTNPDTGKSERKAAIFNPAGGPGNSYLDADTGKPLTGFMAESLNPFQMVKGERGEQEVFNKSTGGSPQKLTSSGNQKLMESAQTPDQLYTTLTPEDRKTLENKVVPEFNKVNQKTIQRLQHVPVIMRRLQDAQTNAAALPQLKAELARFDVGDQRLAQQEFNIFGQRGGYKGWEDWLSNKTTGTITKDFADNMAKAIQNVSGDLRGELSSDAEQRASQFTSRLGGKVDPKLIAPMMYQNYRPQPKGSNLKPNEVIRTTSDGKQAVFDSNTKQFLRWAQ